MLAIVCHVALVTILVETGNYTLRTTEPPDSQALKLSGDPARISQHSALRIQEEYNSTIKNTVPEYNTTISESLQTAGVPKISQDEPDITKYEPQVVKDEPEIAKDESKHRINRGVVVTNGPGCSDIGA